MAIYRVDLEACTGCRKCYEICPMDVFRFDFEIKKSVIAYIEECQTCGQCVINCRSGSLGIKYENDNVPVTSYR